MKANEKELINKSLEFEDSFSSSIHAIDTLTSEVKDIPQTQYDIPSRYNKDRLKVLMINPNSYYIYWEVSDETLKKYSIDLKTQKLVFKIYDKLGNHIFNFDSSFALGEYYLKEKFENIDVYVELGINKEEEFFKILESNNVHTFSSQINFPDENDEVWIKKSMNWSEIIKTTIKDSGNGISSAKFVEEIKKIKEYEDSEIFKNSLSSSSLIKEIK
mgnify:CR=1 FL=1